VGRRSRRAGDWSEKYAYQSVRGRRRLRWRQRWRRLPQRTNPPYPLSTESLAERPIRLV